MLSNGSSQSECMLIHTEQLQFEVKQMQANLLFKLWLYFEHKHCEVNNIHFFISASKLQAFNNTWFRKCVPGSVYSGRRREVSRVTMATNATTVTADNNRTNPRAKCNYSR